MNFFSLKKIFNLIFFLFFLTPSFLNAEVKLPKIIEIPLINSNITLIVNQNDSLFHKDYFISVQEPIIINSEIMPFLVQKNNHFYSYIDSNGNWLSDDNFLKAFSFTRDKLAIVKTKNGYGAINLQGKLQVKDEFQYLSDFINGFAKFKKKNLFGLIDISGKIIINGQTNNLTNVNELNWFVNSQKNKFGVFDVNGKIIIPNKFKELENFSKKGVAIAKQKNLYGVINKKGEFITSEKYSYISNFDDYGYAIAQTSDGSITDENFIIDSNGREVFSTYKTIKSIYPKNIAILEYDFCDYYSFIKKGYIKRGLNYCGPINSKGQAFYRNENKWFLLNTNNGNIKSLDQYNEPNKVYTKEFKGNDFELVKHYKKIDWMNQNFEIIYSVEEKKLNNKYLIELQNKNRKIIWTLLSDTPQLYTYPYYEKNSSDIITLTTFEDNFTNITDYLFSNDFKKLKKQITKNYNNKIFSIFKNKKILDSNSLIIASDYVDSDTNIEFSFLVDQRNEIFDEVYQKINIELTKKYGKPLYSSFIKNKIQNQNKMETKWKIKNKILHLDYYFDYSRNNDFAYMIELVYK